MNIQFEDEDSCAEAATNQFCFTGTAPFLQFGNDEIGSTQKNKNTPFSFDIFDDENSETPFFESNRGFHSKVSESRSNDGSERMRGSNLEKSLRSEIWSIQDEDIQNLELLEEERKGLSNPNEKLETKEDFRFSQESFNGNSNISPNDEGNTSKSNYPSIIYSTLASKQSNTTILESPFNMSNHTSFQISKQFSPSSNLELNSQDSSQLAFDFETQSQLTNTKIGKGEQNALAKTKLEGRGEIIERKNEQLGRSKVQSEQLLKNQEERNNRFKSNQNTNGKRHFSEIQDRHLYNEDPNPKRTKTYHPSPKNQRNHSANSANSTNVNPSSPEKNNHLRPSLKKNNPNQKNNPKPQQSLKKPIPTNSSNSQKKESENSRSSSLPKTSEDKLLKSILPNHIAKTKEIREEAALIIEKNGRETDREWEWLNSLEYEKLFKTHELMNKSQEKIKSQLTVLLRTLNKEQAQIILDQFPLYLFLTENFFQIQDIMTQHQKRFRRNQQRKMEIKRKSSNNFQKSENSNQSNLNCGINIQLIQLKEKIAKQESNKKIKLTKEFSNVENENPYNSHSDFSKYLKKGNSETKPPPINHELLQKNSDQLTGN